MKDFLKILLAIVIGALLTRSCSCGKNPTAIEVEHYSVEETKPLPIGIDTLKIN